MNVTKTCPVSRLLLWGMMLLAFPALATDVLFYLSDPRLGTSPATNRTVWIQGLTPNSSGGTVIIGSKIIKVTDDNGFFGLTNLFGSTNSGLYYCTVQAPPQQTAFKILVQGTNLGAIYAADIMVADATATFPAGAVAWAANVTDGRYAPSTNGGVNNFITSTTATNIAAYQAKIATNAYDVRVTNIVSAIANTNTGVSASAVTNIAAYQAQIATNNLIKNSFTTNAEAAARLVVTNIANRAAQNATNNLVANGQANVGFQAPFGITNTVSGASWNFDVQIGSSNLVIKPPDAPAYSFTMSRLGVISIPGTPTVATELARMQDVTNAVNQLATNTAITAAQATNIAAYQTLLGTNKLDTDLRAAITGSTNLYIRNRFDTNTDAAAGLIVTNIANRAAQDATNKLDTDLRAALTGSTNLYIRNSFDTNTDAAAKLIVTNIVNALSGAVTNQVWATNAADGSITNTGLFVKLLTDENANTHSITNQGPATFNTLVLERKANHSGNSGYASTVLEVFGGAANTIAGTASTANNSLLGGIGNTFSVGSVAASGNVLLGGVTNVMDDAGPVTAFNDSVILGGEFNRLGGASASVVAGHAGTNTHSGTFLWSDQNGGIASAISNSVIFKAQNGLAINTNHPSGKALKVIGDSASDATTLGVNPAFTGTTNVLSSTLAGSAAANGTFVWTGGALLTNYFTATYITNNAGTRQIKNSAGAILYTAAGLTNAWSISTGSAPAPTVIYGETLNANGLNILGAVSSTNLDQRFNSVSNSSGGLSASTVLTMIETNGPLITNLNIAAIPGAPGHVNMDRLFRWQNTLMQSNRPFVLLITEDEINWPIGIKDKFSSMLGQEGGIYPAGDLEGSLAIAVSANTKHEDYLDSNFDTNIFFGRICPYELTNGNTLTVTRTAGGGSRTSVLADTLGVLFLREPMGGTVKLQTNINGGSFADFKTINCNGATTNLLWTNYSVAANYYQVRVVAQAGGGTNRVYHPYAYHSTNRIVMPVLMGVNSGPSFTNFITARSNLLYQFWAGMNPDLMIMQDTGPTNDVAGLQYLEGVWTNACPNADVIVCGMYQTGNDSIGTPFDFNAANVYYRTYCKAQGRAFFDPSFYLTDRNTLTNWYNIGLMLQNGDYVHLSLIGSDLMNDKLWSEMTRTWAVFNSQERGNRFNFGSQSWDSANPLFSFLNGHMGNIDRATNTDQLMMNNSGDTIRGFRVSSGLVKMTFDNDNAYIQGSSGGLLYARGNAGLLFQSDVSFNTYGWLYPGGGWQFGTATGVSPGNNNVEVIGNVIADGQFIGNGRSISNLWGTNLNVNFGSSGVTNADGSVTLSISIASALTNNDTRSINLLGAANFLSGSLNVSNNITVDGAHSLYPTNATAGYVAMIGANHNLTNVPAGGDYPLSSQGNQATAALINGQFPGNIITQRYSANFTNASMLVVSNNTVQTMIESNNITSGNITNTGNIRTATASASGNIKAASFDTANGTFVNSGGSILDENTGDVIYNVSGNLLQTRGALKGTNGILWQGGAQLTNVFYATSNIDFPSVAAGGTFDTNVTCTGAADGDIVSLGWSSGADPSSGTYSARAVAANLVKIRYENNNLASPVDPGAGTFSVEVHKWK